MIQTEKETTKKNQISVEVEARKHLVDTMGERGNISLRKIGQHGEKDVESAEKKNFAKVCKQKATTQLHQLGYSKESFSNKSAYIIEEEIANVETKKKRWVAPILMKTKSSKLVLEYQIDTGGSCSVVSHSLVCKLLQDVNPKPQGSKWKLRMYDGSVLIPYGVIDIKCEVNEEKTKLQFQVAHTKTDPLISASASLALNLVMLNVSNDQVNDEIHGIKITKTKKMGIHFSRRKYWKNMEMSLTYLIVLLENYI